MAKKIARYIDRRKYNYPKGYTVDGKAKTGFMPAKLGAKLFVTQNFAKIQKGDLPYTNLTTREKRVFRGKTSNTFANTFQFGKKRYYDPTGTIKTLLANQIPELENKRNLTNLLPEKDFVDYFNKELNPTKYADGSNSTLFDFVKGDNKAYYRDRSGTSLDIATKLQKTRESGREIQVIGLDGKKYTGTKAIEKMREYESEQLEKVKKETPDGQPIQLQIVYTSTSFNPYTNTITYNLNDTQVNDLNQTP